jgi:hypothetical protein
MNTSTAKKPWFTGSRIFMETGAGRVFSQPLHYYPRLQRASATQRSAWTQTPLGLHWPQVDEDISFESFSWGDATETLFAKDARPARAFA